MLVGPDVTFNCPSEISVRTISESLVKELSTDKNSQKVFASVKFPEQYLKNEMPEEPGKGILLLEGVQDPGNVGTLIRSAVAFGYSGLIMDENCADPFSPKAVHAAAGAILSLWIIRISNLEKPIAKLKNQGFLLMASDLTGDEKDDLSNIDKIILVMGNEGNGISDAMRKMSDALFKIPMKSNGVESLNVGAAGAVAMYMTKRI